jgi:hypothetical protein
MVYVHSQVLVRARAAAASSSSTVVITQDPAVPASSSMPVDAGYGAVEASPRFVADPPDGYTPSCSNEASCVRL